MHDAHCHIDLYPDFRSELAAIAAAKITTLAVTNTPSIFEACERICAGNTFVHPALGLHPELAVERERELPILLRLLPRVRFLGEIGLDFTSRDGVARAAQVRIFTEILTAARAIGGKVLSIHSRRAAAEVVDVIGPRFPGGVILHWFSGSERVLGRAIANGYHFSVNPAMTKSAAGQAIIRAMPPDRLLLESDGPFVVVDDSPARAGDVRLVIAYLATLWRLPLPEVERRLDANLEQLLTRGIASPG